MSAESDARARQLTGDVEAALNVDPTVADEALRAVQLAFVMRSDPGPAGPVAANLLLALGNAVLSGRVQLAEALTRVLRVYAVHLERPADAVAAAVVARSGEHPPITITRRFPGLRP